MRRYTGCLLLGLLLAGSAGWAQRLSEADRARVEALYEEGMGLLKGEEAEGAEARFRAALELDAKHAPSLVGLGHVHLRQGDLNAAEQAFVEARKRKHTYAPAYHGLGLVWRERPNGLNTAIGYFRQTLQYDRNYLEARYQIALARYAMKEPDVKREAERLIEMDASFAPAYLLLGEWYEGYAGNAAEAERYYRQYLSLAPGDVAVLLRLARVYQGRGEPEQVVALLREVASPEVIAALPILAIAYMELDSLEQAEAVFNEYLAGCASEERALYEDIRLLSSSEEYRAYQEAPDRAVFLSRFWGDRDPDVTTSANERMLEHYRRVWYARTHFSQRQQPWDARGDVYVRFGEPDHRSKSDWQNFQQSLAVQRVYVYYEIYNLKRDAFGQTRYEVSYTMGQQDGFSVGSIARLMRLRGDRREEVAVASEQRGTSATEVAYVGLELGDYKEGRQVLRVEVRDMNSGEVVQKEAVFVVK